MRNQNEEAVMTLLGHWVRLLSEAQVAAVMGSNRASAQRLARSMQEQGLVKRSTVMAQNTRPVETLAKVEPDDEAPDFHRLARNLKRLWCRAARRTQVIQLTAKGAKAIGALPPRRLRTSELSHDLQMAEVALMFWNNDGVQQWVRDDHLAKSKRWGSTVPDAEVELLGGKQKVVVECCGLYSAKKLQGFHNAIQPRLKGLGVDAYWLF